jgi:ribosomal protein S18 acetylase RimI-like enzyme
VEGLPHWGLLSIAVAPASQGRGLGTVLLRAAEARARADGHRLMRLTVATENQQAVRAYEKEGWVRCIEEGRWHGAMGKRLE